MKNPKLWCLLVSIAVLVVMYNFFVGDSIDTGIREPLNEIAVDTTASVDDSEPEETDAIAVTVGEATIADVDTASDSTDWMTETAEETSEAVTESADAVAEIAEDSTEAAADAASEATDWMTETTESADAADSSTDIVDNAPDAVVGPIAAETGPFWNTWFEIKNGRIANRKLRPNSHYTFTLDLSLARLNLHFADVVDSSAVGLTLAGAIESAEDDDRPLQIWIHPVLIGATATSNVSHRSVMSILEHQSRGSLANKGVESPDLRVVAKANRIGVVGSRADNQPYKIDLQTGAPGCGAIALSIWDGSGTQPLDHIVHRFQIGDAEADCATDEVSRPLRTGFETLLQRVTSANLSLDTERIEAALHVFEFVVKPRRTIGIAVFLRSNNDPKVEPTFWSWRLGNPLSSVLSGTNFLRLLADAQSVAAGKESTREAYASVAIKLKKYLFDNVEAIDQQEASDAFEALRQLVEGANTPPFVLARLVDQDGEMLYLPLRLLSAGGEEAPLKKPMSVVQPLPRERSGTTENCVTTWSFGLPNQLSLDSAPETQWIPPGTFPWLRDFMRSIDELEDYFSYSLPATKESEGLLLVAHQSEGNLWFEDAKFSIPSGAILRGYYQGSVAVLASCAALGMDDANRLVLDRLNQGGIDTIIAAPYQVLREFGVALGNSFADVIYTYRTNPSQPSPTLASLFDKAALQAAETLSKTLPGPPRYLHDMRYEFEILGDHSVRLCGPQESRG